MSGIAEKLQSVERDIHTERGPFTLFALVERDDHPGKWDVVVSAPWFGRNDRDTLNYLVRKLQSVLTKEEVTSLARVVLLKPTDEWVKSVSDYSPSMGRPVELRNQEIAGVPVRRALIIAAHPPQ
jgi:predicted sugar kinase